MDKKTTSFIDLIESNKGLIYKIVHGYCRDQEDRQDLYQEIILQLWKSFGSYNGKVKRSTWMYRIALNTSISFYRTKQKLKQKIIQYKFERDQQISEYDDQEDTRLSMLRASIQDLRAIDKAVIMLHLEGLSQKEIGEVLGMSATNAGTKISRIKIKLRKILKNKKIENG